MSVFDNQNAMSYDDIFILPQYSEISTRQQVDVSLTMAGGKIAVPIMAANMDTVMCDDMAVGLAKAGACGALHRFQSIEDASKEYWRVHNLQLVEGIKTPIFVSIGVNRDSKERAQELFKDGARNFVIDIAHGHSANMKEMLHWLQKEFGTDEIFYMAGNVATWKGAHDLITWGAHAIKAGVGPGSVCKTKNVTGVTVPQAQAVRTVVHAAKESSQLYGRKFYVVADGGCTEIGDVCKAIGLGADMVMSGRFFAGCNEAPQGTLYRGSASEAVQTKYRTERTVMPTPEGTTEMLEQRGPVSDVVELIAGGLRSAFSYSNAKNMKEFHNQCKFGIRHNKS